MSETNQPVINVPGPVCYDGEHYDGVTIHNGVSLGQKRYPCDPEDSDRRAYDFQNCAQDTSGLYLAFPFRNVEVSERPNPHYLQLMPAV